MRLFAALVLLIAALSAHAQDSSLASETEARVLVLVNATRAQHGLPPLEREPRLDAAAQYLAGYMANAGTLDHRVDGNSPGARVKQRGYAYCDIAENIGMEYDSRGFTPERLARGFVGNWRDSATHRANLLHDRATQTGLGVARNAAGEYFAAQVFARPRAARGPACPR